MLLSVAVLCLIGCANKSGDNPKDSIVLSEEQLRLEAAQSVHTVDVTASGKWSAQSDAEWCSVTCASTQLLVTTESNTSTTPRECVIVASCGKADAVLTVSQACDKGFSVEPSSITVGYSSSEHTLGVTSSRSWNVTCEESWLSVEPNSGNGSGNVTVKVAGNEKAEKRVARLVFKYIESGAVKTCEVAVEQAAADGKITIQSDTVRLENKAATTTVEFDAVGEWTVTQSEKCDWMEVSPLEGVTGHHSLQIKVTENESLTDDRVVTLVVNATGGKQYPLTIKQSRIPSFTLRLMDYNVHNGINTLGAYTPRATAALIKEYAPDCVAVQEIDSMTQREQTSGRFVLRDIGLPIGMSVAYYPALDSYRGGKYGVGMLSKVQPLSFAGQKIPYTTEQRAVLMVEFEKFWYLSTHFDDGVEQRLSAAKQITALAEKLSKDKYVFLAGDLNAVRSEDCVKYFEQYFTILNDPTEPTAGAADTPVNKRCIDYIFVYKTKAGRQANVSVTQRQVINQGAALTVSDHFPLFVDVLVIE